MSEQGGFFQFPLCMLASKEPLLVLLERIFRYGVVDFLKKTEPEFLQKSAEENERCFNRARNLIGFKNGTVSDFVTVHREAERGILSFPEKTFSVRFKTNYLFEIRNESMLTEREFRVLAGIYSVIGSKEFAKIGWPMIQARASGHLSVGNPKRYLGPVYSRSQIEKAIKELLDRKFVSSFTYNKGERFWSHRLLPPELASAVATAKTWAIRAHEERAALNAKMSTAIATRIHANMGPSAKSKLPTAGQSQQVTSTLTAPEQHVSSTSPSTGSSTSPSTLKETP